VSFESPIIDKLVRSDSEALGEELLSITQQDNIRFFEKCVNRRWGLGQNIVLSWCRVPSAIQLLMVPHYFLGNFSARSNCEIISDHPVNELVVKLISGNRELTLSELTSYGRLLNIDPTEIKLPTPLHYTPLSKSIIEQIIRRYSVNYVESRAVVLFDIAGFGKLQPFEQMSQLNSLAYSLNSAHKKLLSRKINIHFARSTTGDGFYVWNRSLDIFANVNLFHFLHLVLADNAIAQSKSSGKVTPKIKAAYHIGSHYEFHQAEGINPSYYSYIVGNVTIQLARMLDQTKAGQIVFGDFRCGFPTSCNEDAYLVEKDTIGFIERSAKYLNDLVGIRMSGGVITKVRCYLTGEQSPAAGRRKTCIRVVDKHDQICHAYNARIQIYRHNADSITMGLEDNHIPRETKSYIRETSY